MTANCSHWSRLRAVAGALRPIASVPAASLHSVLPVVLAAAGGALAGYAWKARSSGSAAKAVVPPVPGADYGGPKCLDQEGHDAGQSDPRSVVQVRLNDRFYAAATPPVGYVPQWALVPRGQKVSYAHALPGVASDLGGLVGERALPVMVVTGAVDGPTIMLIAGEHGNEYESIVALQTLMNEVDPAALRGTIVGVTVTSIDSYLANQRQAKSDEKNLARVWPGTPSQDGP